jgi:hypothetical protein
MLQSINDYLVGDAYAPTVLKPSLQQYDNYQIYSIACVDVNYRGYSTNNDIPPDVLFTRFIAWQTYSIVSIRCDFNAIVNTYK